MGGVCDRQVWHLSFLSRPAAQRCPVQWGIPDAVISCCCMSACSGKNGQWQGPVMVNSFNVDHLDLAATASLLVRCNLVSSVASHEGPN